MHSIVYSIQSYTLSSMYMFTNHIHTHMCHIHTLSLINHVILIKDIHIVHYINPLAQYIYVRLIQRLEAGQ